MGGEPSYKQVERMQKVDMEIDKWRPQEILAQPVEGTYMEQKQDYLPQQIYYTDVNGILQSAIREYCLCYKAKIN